ncbi:MAG: PDZ domain-containing protein, partial [Pirellulales bacterium]|nr:PDZ domain-containing protein [Pirellulales bacterium]
MPKRNLFFIIFVVFAGMLAWLARDHGGHGRRFAEVLATVEQRYVEPVNGEQMFAAAMNGLFSSLDEHSSFISGTLKEDLNISLDQEFGGVGLELATRDNLIEVQSPIVRSPAWSAGIVAGDIIESIDGRSTAGWSLSEVVAALRGTPGTVVTLGLSSVKTDPTLRTLDPTAIIPSVNEKKNVSLIREQVLVESVLGDRRLPDGSWNWWIQAEENVALIRITQFGERTVGEVRAALQAISRRCTTDGVNGIVIDLRNNGGGLLESAVDVCNLFL